MDSRPAARGNLGGVAWIDW